MNKKKVLKWVRALESGKYKQTRGCLFSPYKNRGILPSKDGKYYCCLGVACAALDNNQEPDGSVLLEFDYMDRIELYTEHYDLGISLGLDQKTQDKLMRLNDRGKKDFKYIARWIRKNILGEDIIIDINRKALRERKGK